MIVPEFGDRRLERPPSLQDVTDTPGAYVLFLELPRPACVSVGALANLDFPAASYAYVGSAMGGLSRRVRRYARPVTRPRWHIDYLLTYTRNVTLLTAVSRERIECSIAMALAGSLPSVPRFGSSDCRCESHLFSASHSEEALAAASDAIRRTGAVPTLHQASPCSHLARSPSPARPHNIICHCERSREI